MKRETEGGDIEKRGRMAEDLMRMPGWNAVVMPYFEKMTQKAFQVWLNKDEEEPIDKKAILETKLGAKIAEGFTQYIRSVVNAGAMYSKQKGERRNDK